MSESRPVGPRMHVAIVGAGIFGVAAGLELRRRGHAVTLCDPGPLPHPLAESTDISKVVRMDYVDEFYSRLMAATFTGWADWNRRWGEELYHQVGFLVLSREELRPGGFESESLAALARRGELVDRLDAAAIARHFPAWAPGVYRDGYFNPLAGWAESGRVVGRLLGEARDLGVVVRLEAVAGLEEGDAAIRGVRLRSGAMLAADLVLVAAGSWTPLLVPHLSDRLWSTAQTVLHFHTDAIEMYQPPRFPVWAAEIGREGWYGFPALADGTVKIANHGPGRPLHPDGERAVLAEDEARFRRFLGESLPGLAAAPILGRRLCLYSDSWDGDFLIDHDPERHGLVVATGGSGHGFKFAPSLGPIIADVVERRENPWAERFRWRPRGVGQGGRK